MCHSLGHGVDEGLQRVVEPGADRRRPGLHGDEAAVALADRLGRLGRVAELREHLGDHLREKDPRTQKLWDFLCDSRCMATSLKTG